MRDAFSEAIQAERITLAQYSYTALESILSLNEAANESTRIVYPTTVSEYYHGSAGAAHVLLRVTRILHEFFSHVGHVADCARKLAKELSGPMDDLYNR